MLGQIVEELKYDYAFGVWLPTSKYKWIKDLPAKSKGALAEKIYIKFCEKNGCKISPCENKDHDCIMDGSKKEIKLSTVGKDGKSLTFFQIRQFQDYDDLVFICVFPDEIQIFEINKKDYMENCGKIGKIIWAGGKEKMNRLRKDISKNDLFHWSKKVDESWPDGTRRIA